MLTAEGVEFKTVRFPAGESQIIVTSENLPKEATINLYFESNNDMVELLLLVDALKAAGCRPTTLYVPYFPAARQDRRQGVESLGMEVYAVIIDLCGFDNVITVDLHNGKLLGGYKEIPQKMAFVMTAMKYLTQDTVLVAPDKGAVGKVGELRATLWNLGLDLNVLQCAKERDYHTGRISSIEVPGPFFGQSGGHFMVVDDICDGGATFILLAEAIREKYGEDCVLDLYTTHGIYSKGTEELKKHYRHLISFNKEISRV